MQKSNCSAEKRDIFNKRPPPKKTFKAAEEKGYKVAFKLFSIKNEMIISNVR